MICIYTHTCMHIYYIHVYKILCNNIFIVSGEVHLILANDSNDITFAEDDGEVSITVSLSKVLSQRFIATYRLISGTASMCYITVVHLSSFLGFILKKCNHCRC